MNKLYVVGIGPGNPEEMTLRARKALEGAQVIAGYGTYVELVRPLFPEKEYLVTAMRHETERCRLALDAACEGKLVAMISSGDAGVYGMAGLICELAKGRDVEIEVIPGVTAALSGGAVLGAPLTHDFAVISLSDLLTDWEKIEKRLEMAAEADFCIAIYNPASHRRAGHLRRACEILLRHARPDTVCGIVRNIGRDQESMKLMTLEALKDFEADMFTTVFVGNSQTQVIDGRMVTPRGYRNV